MTVKIASSRGQRVGQAEGMSLENTDNCLSEFHYEELERVRAVPVKGSISLEIRVVWVDIVCMHACITGEAEDTEDLSKMPRARTSAGLPLCH